MAKCIVCGNEYAKSFSVFFEGQEYIFDSFECAIHRLAPSCVHCGCRIIGHGSEAGNQYYCGASCARNAGIAGIKDHQDEK